MGCFVSARQSATRQNSPYFKTHFQDESQFIVEQTSSDLAEMIYYAKNESLPAERVFRVTATERSDSQFRLPVYDVEVTYSTKGSPLRSQVDVKSPIWEPDI